MLEHLRYIQVFNALERLRGKKELGLGENTKQMLMVEQWKTQEALARLEVSADTPIAEIPQINEFLPSQTPSERLINCPKIIEVLGLANAGKTTLIENTVRNSHGSYYYTKEPYQEAKRRASSSVSPYAITQLIQKGFATEALSYVELINNMDLENRPIICDRYLVSHTVFERLWFLWGHITPLNDESSLDALKQIEKLTKYKEFSYGLLLCLISPQVYFQRKGNKPVEYVRMQLEQNLRFHSEVLNYNELTGKSRPFTYASLDLNGPLEENKVLFDNTLNEMLSVMNN